MKKRGGMKFRFSNLIGSLGIKNKLGLSAVVATLIIILLVLVAVGILWAVISNVIEGGAGQVELADKCRDIRFSNVGINEEGGGNYTVTLTRTSSGERVDGAIVTFSNAAGTSSGPLEFGVGIGILDSITREIDTSEGNNVVTNANLFSVTPYFIDEAGNRDHCPQTISFTVGAAGTATPVGNGEEDPVAPECTTDADCEDPAEPYCDDGLCVECIENTDCDEGDVCDSGVCVEEQCTTDADCEGDDVCDDGLCVQCIENEHCGGDDVCDNNICVAPECTEDVDCDEGEKCDNNLCIDLCDGTWESQYFAEDIYECDGEDVHGCSSCTCDTGFSHQGEEGNGTCDLNDPVNEGEINSVWQTIGSAYAFNSDDLPKSNTELATTGAGYNNFYVNFTGSSEERCFPINYAWYDSDSNMTEINLDTDPPLSNAEIYPGELYNVWEAANCGLPPEEEEEPEEE